MSRWVEGVVVQQKAWTDKLYSIYINAPIDAFIAGQFTQIGLMIDEQIVFRPYSFANAAHNSTLEFYYSVLPHGQLTPRLMQLKPGDTLFVAKKPAGRFTLEAVPPATDLWLLATGTGLGVFLSLLQTRALWERFSNVILAHSVRQGSELTHIELIRQIANEQGAKFCYIPIVTREEVPDALHQRLPALLGSQALEQRAGIILTPTRSQVMLCGNPLMVQEVVEVLATKGLVLHHANQPGHISVESYWKEKK